jgi:putative transposase
MANTYTQIYIQIVFAVRGRQNLILPQNKENLQKYITGIVTHRSQKLYAINCMPDHSHLFISIKPDLSISDLVRDIKTGSSNYINKNRLIMGKFNWQEGFAAFSYSHSHIDKVIKYILNQDRHHKKTTFMDEYLEFLNKFHVDYNEAYIFDWIE